MSGDEALKWAGAMVMASAATCFLMLTVNEVRRTWGRRP